MARRTLDAAKKELSEAFLGRGGIHAVGVNRSQKAIRLYVHSGAGQERDRVIEEARRAATPFSVVVVEEQPPTALA
jgi:hypothetical protein